MGEELFRTTLMGGFDKEDVLQKVTVMKEESYAEKNKLLGQIRERDEKIRELNKRLELKEAQREKLEQEISQKYQKYIDNYESIGRLIFDTQVRCDDMIAQAKEESQQILEAAREEAQKQVDSVQAEVDEKLAEGKRKYIAVQEELNEIVELINQAQRRFMASYKEVHEIVNAMPASLREMEDESEDEAVSDACELTLEEPEEKTESAEPILAEEASQDDLDEELDDEDEFEDDLDLARIFAGEED